MISCTATNSDYNTCYVISHVSMCIERMCEYMIRFMLWPSVVIVTLWIFTEYVGDSLISI